MSSLSGLQSIREFPDSGSGTVGLSRRESSSMLDIEVLHFLRTQLCEFFHEYEAWNGNYGEYVRCIHGNLKHTAKRRYLHLCISTMPLQLRTRYPPPRSTPNATTKAEIPLGVSHANQQMPTERRRDALDIAATVGSSTWCFVRLLIIADRQSTSS